MLIWIFVTSARTEPPSVNLDLCHKTSRSMSLLLPGVIHFRIMHKNALQFQNVSSIQVIQVSILIFLIQKHRGAQHHKIWK